MASAGKKEERRPSLFAAVLEKTNVSERGSQLLRGGGGRVGI